MSSTTVVTITSAKNAATIADMLDKADPKTGANQLASLVSGMAGGAYDGKIELAIGAVAASATLTFDTVIATDVVVVNGVSIACVASGAGDDEFNKGSDDDESATNCAAAINESVAGIVTASASGAVVTVTAVEEGDGGNAITISSPDTTITASAARLASGVDGTAASWSFGIA